MSGRQLFSSVVAFAMVTLGLVAAPVAAGASSHDVLARPTLAGDGLAHGERRRQPGTLLSAERIDTVAALPGARATYAVRYVSSDEAGRPTVVTGLISVPDAPPPPGGWPVLSWAHGTTGVADVCAPSMDTETGPAHDYLGRINTTLASWTSRGFVVAQTDYQGLGSPGPHPYLNGVIEANNVIDIVRAARQLDPRVGRTWFTEGHSQGGQGAVVAAARAQDRQPSLRFLGAVSVAPASGLVVILDHIVSNGPGAAGAISFLPLIILGAAATNPAVQPDQLLTETGMRLIEVAESGCIAQLRNASVGLTIPDVIRADADWGPLRRALAAQEPADFPPDVPVLIAQGGADVVVPQVLTDALVASLCRSGTPVQYLTYPGVDHRGAVEASNADVSTWLEQRRAGITPPTTCAG